MRDTSAAAGPLPPACRGSAKGGRANPRAVHPSDFVGRIDDPYFLLRPDTVLIRKGEDTVKKTRATHRTIDIQGVRTTVVRGTSIVDGVVEEDTFDYYAKGKMGNV